MSGSGLLHLASMQGWGRVRQPAGGGAASTRRQKVVNWLPPIRMKFRVEMSVECWGQAWVRV